MINIDSESRYILKTEINKLRNSHISGLPDGHYYDDAGAFRPGLFEYNRGIIHGMKLIIDLLEPPPETQSAEQTNDEQS